MNLASPSSAILSAVIFNALIIVVLIPLALKGVRYRAVGAAALTLRRNLAIYGLGGLLVPVHRHQGHRPAAVRVWTGLRRNIMKNILRPAFVVFFVLTLVTGIAYPLVVTGIAQSLFPAQAERQPDHP
jgi:hypothetical protein